ncbi:MAG: hypothetical protein JHC93_01825 [Parachlamydiales bacterium]|nr:hypothetical protein [Parachlamydiales bacterium]
MSYNFRIRPQTEIQIIKLNLPEDQATIVKRCVGGYSNQPLNKLKDQVVYRANERFNSYPDWTNSAEILKEKTVLAVDTHNPNICGQIASLVFTVPYKAIEAVSKLNSGTKKLNELIELNNH